MSSKRRKLCVILEHDMHCGEVDQLCNVLKGVRGVAEVLTGEPLDAHDYIARQSAKEELRGKLRALLAP